MALTIYRSSDPGAPALPYSTGGLVALLDACLRTGYGSKPGAGWTKPFTGTGIACFKQGAGGNGRFVRVWNARTGDDPSTYCMTANVRGYENMTAVSTGTGPFPTTAQSNGNGLMVRVAASSPGFAPSWILRANSNWFDLLINTGYQERLPGVPNNDSYFAFGAFPSMKSGDLYNDYIFAGRNTDYWSYVYARDLMGACYVSRSDTGAAGAREAALLPAGQNNESYLGWGEPGRFPFPNRVNSTVVLQQQLIHCDGYLRGTLPGIWTSPHGLSALGWGNTFGGQGSLAGRAFEVAAVGVEGSSGVILETTDTFSAV